MGESLSDRILGVIKGKRVASQEDVAAALDIVTFGDFEEFVLPTINSLIEKGRVVEQAPCLIHPYRTTYYSVAA